MIALDADGPIASESPDHLHPAGAATDNSRNRNFNRKMYALFQGPIEVLDLGCAGGAFVRSCIDDGHLGVGIEGSDYAQRHLSGEWATIADHLFTGDVTRTFTVRSDGLPMKFDVVTAWEFMEHIATPDLPGVCENVRASLRPGGLWIMSINTKESVENGVVLHQTVQPQGQWLDLFEDQGFVALPKVVRYFGGDWVRGPLQGDEGSFHLVLRQREDAFRPLDIPSAVHRFFLSVPGLPRRSYHHVRRLLPMGLKDQLRPLIRRA